MAEKVVVYWRDIPAQVIVKAGRKTAKRQLPERFEQAIDRAAMRAKLTGTDAYLEQWRRADPVPCGDDLEAEAAAAAEALEAEYTPERLRELVANGGRAAPDVRRPPLVDPPRRLLGAVLPPLRVGLCRGRPGAAARRARAPGGARRRARAQRQGAAVRLPDVRQVRAQRDRHVLPDELPQADAQRPLRRRAAERALRGQAGDALRLGAGLGRLAADGARATGSPSCSRRSTIAARAVRPGCASSASASASL